MSWFFFIYIDWFFFFFKQKTAYEMRISDWSSDVCSSDLGCEFRPFEWLCCPQNTLRRIFYSSRRRKNYAAPGIGGVFYESRPKSSSGLVRSEEHTSELQSLMRISYAVFCLKKKKNNQTEQEFKKIKTNRAQYN